MVNNDISQDEVAQSSWEMCLGVADNIVEGMTRVDSANYELYKTLRRSLRNEPINSSWLTSDVAPDGVNDTRKRHIPS